MKRLLLFCMLFLLVGAMLPAQEATKTEVKDAPLRIEMAARSDKETHQVIPCGHHGVMLLFRSVEQVGGNLVNWYFTWYDQNLQQIWIKRIPLLSEQAFVTHRVQNDTLFILFLHYGKNKEPMVDFGVLKIHLSDASFVFYPGKIEEKQEVVYFSVGNDRTWVGFHGLEGVDKFLYMDLKSGSLRTISLGEGNALSIRWAGMEPKGTAMDAIVTRRVGKSVFEHYFVRYDTMGVIRKETLLITGSPELQFTHFKAFHVDADQTLIMGGYVQGVPSKKKSEELVSTGFFTALLNHGVQKSVQFFNFLDFKNATSLLSDKEIMDLKKKALKRGKTKKEYSLDYPLVFKEPIRIGDQIVLQSEVYTSQFRTESYTDFDFYGRPYTNSYSVFDGFRFQSAIVAGFDASGKLIWDNVLEIRNLLSFDTEPKMVIYGEEGQLVLAYLSDGKIGFKIIEGANVKEKLSYNSLDLLYPEDKLLTESRSRMVAWYDNYFLCYGYQEIKNIALSTNNKRFIFFINKVRFNP